MNSMIRPGLQIRLRKLARRFGADLTRRRPILHDLLQHHGITTVLDVGANVGQFASALRTWGYRGRIISFEPVPEAFAALVKRAARDVRWSAMQLALGDQDGQQILRVSRHTVFSSLREMGEPLRRRFPAAADVHEQTIVVRRLDSIWAELVMEPGRVLLKCDTQGYEREVLLGARGVLDSVYGVQLEASVEPLYRGEARMTELMALMEQLGFALGGIEAGTHERATGRLLQADCLFLRPSGSRVGGVLPSTVGTPGKVLPS
jgi:FkbM family methyltransferase